MRAQGAEAFRIEIIEERGLLVTKWIGSKGAPRNLATQVNPSQLKDLRVKVGCGLQKVKQMIGANLGPIDWRTINRAAHELQSVGDQFAEKLFGNSRQRMVDMWREYLKDGYGMDASIPIVTIIGMAINMVPFELLPCLYDPREDSLCSMNINTADKLAQFMRQFVGFSCIIKRVVEVGEIGPRGTDPENSMLLRGEPHLPIKLFVCRSLPGVIKEEAHLRSFSDNLDVDAWPKKGKRGNTRELAKHLWHINETTEAVTRPVPDQIHHFAGHCDTTNADSDRHSITLAGCGSSEFSSTLRSLFKIFSQLRRKPIPDRPRPLVFVNACGSSRVNPDQVGSFPNLFLNTLESRGYIGTETTMSDAVAAEFSLRFYERLLSGSRLGESLHDVRWFLIRQYRNPLGLFYTCYADPEIRLNTVKA